MSTHYEQLHVGVGFFPGIDCEHIGCRPVAHPAVVCVEAPDDSQPSGVRFAYFCERHFAHMIEVTSRDLRREALRS